MNSFKCIRKHKNPLVKRNGVCLYDGQLMRIANTHHDGLVLRKEVICHAQDPDLLISKNDGYMEVVAGISQVETIRKLRRLVAQMDDHMPLVLQNDSFEKQWRKDARLILDKTLLGIYVNEDNNNE